MSNEFGFKSYRQLQKKERGMWELFIELVRPRLLWLMGY